MMHLDNSDISISKKENLVVKVFVVGYPVCGESIIVLFIDSEHEGVIYSCVIDCFVHENNNKTRDVLEQYGVKALNVLCWSHPDKDHSYGLSDLISYFCDESTLFLVPSGVHFKPYERIKYNKIGTNEVFDSINSFNRQTKRSFASVETSGRGNYEVTSFCLMDYPEEVPIEIHALTPPSPLLNERIMNNKKIAKNELSIMLRIMVDGHKFLFCSDVENEAIGYLRPRDIANPVFLKIPHHGSDTSNALLNKIELSINNTYGCVTKYYNKLPYDYILADYVNRCKMIHYTDSSLNHKFGMVEYTFKPYSLSDNGTVCSSMTIDCHGNATRLKGTENLYQKPK